MKEGSGRDSKPNGIYFCLELFLSLNQGHWTFLFLILFLLKQIRTHCILVHGSLWTPTILRNTVLLALRFDFIQLTSSQSLCTWSHRVFESTKLPRSWMENYNLEGHGQFHHCTYIHCPKSGEHILNYIKGDEGKPWGIIPATEKQNTNILNHSYFYSCKNPPV